MWGGSQCVGEGGELQAVLGITVSQKNLCVQPLPLLPSAGACVDRQVMHPRPELEARRPQPWATTEGG